MSHRKQNERELRINRLFSKRDADVNASGLGWQSLKQVIKYEPEKRLAETEQLE